MPGLLQKIFYGPRSVASLSTGAHIAAVSAALLLGACATTVQPPAETTPPGQGKPATAPAPVPALPPISAAEQDTLRNWVVEQDRLYRVAAPLLINNTDLCKGSARNLLGFTAKNRYSYSTDFADAAQKMFRLEERLQVMDVLPGSGAAKSGVRRGDILISANDKALPDGPNAERSAATVLGPLVSKRGDVKLNILRNARALTLMVPLTHACGFGIELGNTDGVAAYSDGRRLLITRGMMNYAVSDKELAYVLAREMAHNALGHPQKQRMTAAAGSMIDNLIRMHPDPAPLSGMGGIMPMPAALDTSADMLALYMVARGGYDGANAVEFWKKLAQQYPASVANGYTALHPATAARVAIIEKTSVTIRQKQAAKKALTP